MAHKCGDDTALYSGRLTLNPLAHLDLFGTLAFFLVHVGWAKPVPVNPNNFRNYKRDDILVSVAGVGANLISAVLFALIFRVLLSAFPAEAVAALYYLDRGIRIQGVGSPLIASLIVVLLIAVSFNLVLLFFNLIPIPPLDGSHVLKQMLPWSAREWYEVNIARNGMFILLALIFLLPMMFGFSILDIIIGTPVAVLTQLLTGLY